MVAILVQFEIDSFVCACGIGRSACTCEFCTGRFRNGRESATACRKSRSGEPLGYAGWKRQPGEFSFRDRRDFA